MCCGLLFAQIECGQVEALRSLLCSFYFLYANVRHGLMHHLLETYSLYGEGSIIFTACDCLTAILP